MAQTTHYHLLQQQDSDHTAEFPEQQELSITREDWVCEEDDSKEKSLLWRAVVNLICSIEGTGLLALPYLIAQTGLVAVAALIFIPFVAYYTGAILIECLYDRNGSGEKVRVRSDYKELGEACLPRYGGVIAVTVQLVELLFLASSYVVLFASLSAAAFPDAPLSDKLWMVIAAAAGLPAIFIKNLSQVAWMSLVSVVALFLAIMAVLSYGIAHNPKWNPSDILVLDAEKVFVTLAVVIFSYICHPVLPTVEASMKKKSQFRTMLVLTFVSVALIKVGFSVCAFLSFSSNVQDVIVNSLPMGYIRMSVNVVLLVNVLFSYPFIVIAIIKIIEESVSPASFSFKIPDIVWFVCIRVLVNFFTLLPAISIPHFALVMAFAGSLTGCCTAFAFPAVFHLIIKKEELRVYHYVLDVSVVIFAIIGSIFGFVYTGKSLFEAYSSQS